MKLLDKDGKIVVPDEYKEYKKVYNYFKYHFENDVLKDKKMVEAFKEVTGASKEKLKEFVKWNSGPKLEIKDLGYDSYNNKVEGKWLSASKNPKYEGVVGPFNFKDGTIQLDEKLIQEIEDSRGDIKKVLMKYLKVVTVHECAHGAAEDSGPEYSKGDGDTREVGWEFEEKYLDGKVYYRRPSGEVRIGERYK